MTLLERLQGPMGTAYHWQYPAEACTELAEKGQMFSDTFWLVHLPEYIPGHAEEDEKGGVVCLSWNNCDHEAYAQFKHSEFEGIRERFRGAFQLTLSDAWGDDVRADDPNSYDDLSDPILMDNGNSLDSADQLMRLWVDALLCGALDPDEGCLAAASEEEAIAFYNDMRRQAEADPLAHTRKPVSNQPALF